MVIVGNTASKRVAEKCGFKFEVVVLHRAAFGTPHMTIEGQLSWMRMPEYDPTLDLVAVAPDGALAAYVLCSISKEENLLTGRRVGYTDPVATHPKFQGRGLAKALLVTGLNLLRQRGMEVAGLGTGSWNMAMQATAKSVGYRVASTTILFEKPGK
jgi:mycothiol synthase